MSSKSTTTEKKKMVKTAPSVSKTKRSGLRFSVGRISRMLRNGYTTNRLADNAAVYLAGVLEYLSSELLEMSYIKSRTGTTKNRRIAPRHLMLSIQDDVEFRHLIGSGVSVISGGVRPSFVKTVKEKNSGEEEEGEEDPEKKTKKKTKKVAKKKSKDENEESPVEGGEVKEKKPKKKSKKEVEESATEMEVVA